MGKISTAFASYCGSALWWLCDKIWRDQIFAVIKPMIPDWVIHGVPLAEIVRQTQTWGPPAILVLIGTTLFLSQRRQLIAIGKATLSVREVVTPLKSSRPLPIALSVESLGSYMRTSPRVGRLDDAIAKMGRKQMDNGPTMAFGLFPDLKGFGVANVAEVDALLEEKEELVLHSATHWTFKEDVPIGACVWELCKVLRAEQGNDNYTKKIIDDYLAAKGAK